MYATGSAANPAALLAALETFAVSAGWTVDRSTAVYNPGSGGGSASDYWLAVHKGACYLNFWYHAAFLGVVLHPADAYNGSNAPSAQATVLQPASASYMNIAAGPFTGYHFFSTTAGPKYLHVVIEISGGLYGQLHGGILNAVGGASPALYSASTSWQYGSAQASFFDNGPNVIPFCAGGSPNTAFVFVTVDGVLGWQYGGAVSPNRLTSSVKSGGFQNRGVLRTPNTFNELTVLFPLHQFAERAAGGVWSHIGDVFDMRACNMKNVNPQDEITIGSDVWKYFPAAAKTPPSTWNVGGSTITTSGPYGYAFRKNA